MILALLAGQKTQTRRAVKPQPKVEPRLEPLVGEAWASGFVDVRCLGRSKDGHPRHPLMIAYDTPLKLLDRANRG